MSGTIGHLMYAILGAREAAQRQLPLAAVLRRHLPSYLAGSYLGCDIQTMPEAICLDTGREVGYGTAPLDKSPLTGGPLRPFRLRFRNVDYSPRQIHQMFYGRAHLLFGWSPAEQDLAEPWDHLADYCSSVVEDAAALFGPGDRSLAYVCGWMTHVVGDCLIKSIRPGLDLHLVDGLYTPRNRPVQDLITFHEIGVKELKLDWPALLASVADTPVEPVQPHYMRVGPPRGRLAENFSRGWLPEQQDLLLAVLAENRRYFRVWSRHELELLALKPTADGWQCHQTLSGQSGGLSYAEMVRAADRAGFRDALGQIGQAVADLFTQVTAQNRFLRQLPRGDDPGWLGLP